MASPHIVSCVLNQTPLDWNGNFFRIDDAIYLARKKNGEILLFPELTFTGVGCEDAFFAPWVSETALDQLFKLLPKTEGLFVLVGLPLRVGGALFNAMAAISDGEIVGFICKPDVSSSRLSCESRWFTPWAKNTHWTLNLRGKSYPVGDLTLNDSGKRIGVEFCDLPIFDEEPLLLEKDRNLDIVLNPAVSPFELGKHDRRKQWVEQRSRELGTIYATTNLLGCESGGILYDGTAIITFPDKPVFASEPFPFSPAVHSWQENSSCEPSDPNTEFALAVSHGTLDYGRKIHARGFTLSLSGGADSASLAVLVRIGVERALLELGPEGFRKHFPTFPVAEKIDDLTPETITHQILTCIYQRTKNSSGVTQNAAKTIADSVGAKFMEFDIEPLVNAYTSMVENGLSEKLRWEEHDLALQNIQARTRGPSAWMVANVRNHLLLATGNRSEAAVGYATMDGDTCGGLAPIAGIDKHFLRQWLHWLQTEGLRFSNGRILKFTSLETINSQQPTAELRPSEMHQTDEADLMPYEVLNKIEELAIEKLHSPEEVTIQLPRLFPQYEKSQLRDWVKRFFRLWAQNQWKRERTAPSFHLDSRNLSPRSWCRFPVISGGFKCELDELGQ